MRGTKGEARREKVRGVTKTEVNPCPPPFPLHCSADENAQIAASMRSANDPPATPTLSKSMFWGFGR